MRKLALACVVLFMSAIGLQAQPQLSWSFKALTIQLPFLDVGVVHLYDFVDDKNLLGGETTVATLSSLNLTVGAVTDIEGQGTPFFGLDTVLPESFFDGRVRFGAFMGYDFNTEEKRAGIKSSVLLW